MSRAAVFRSCARLGLALLTAGAAVPATVAAQGAGPRPELRLDVTAPAGDDPTLLHAGVGASLRLSTYARAAMIAAVGSGRDGGSARGELLARFHTDPFAASAWGLYGGAGGGVLWSPAPEPYIVLQLGLERSASARQWAPAVELGFSRGWRAAVVLRRAARDGRR